MRHRQSLLAGAAGLWTVLVLMKLGNPVVLDQQVSAPGSLEELMVASWPVRWGYVLGLPLVLIGAAWAIRFGQPVSPFGLVMLPATWLIWQVVAGFQTMDGPLTLVALQHFTACATAYYFGLLVLSRLSHPRLFWVGLVAGFLAVMLIGWRQHFGGLEETRRYFYSLPDWQRFPPEFIQKLSSDRIYGTLFYPNALAGGIILLLPPALGVVWDAGSMLPPALRWLSMTIVAALGAACLFWSGSKAGWLIVLGQGMATLVLSRSKLTFKIVMIAVLFLVGLTAFWARHQAYFAKGATSASARFTYWKVATHTAMDHPLFGTGPGTFGLVYARMKPPDAEMTRLTHNDYLQMASDSGWPGMLLYAAWILGGIAFAHRIGRRASAVRHEVADLATMQGTNFGTWLGLSGLAVQGCVEFWLYIPALSWNAFLLLGWLVARKAAITNPPADGD